jgi:shikimate kinase
LICFCLVILSRGQLKAHGFFCGVRFFADEVSKNYCLKGRSHMRDYMNIILIGYRCCGKTEVGKILARELRRAFLDTDSLIERNTGCSIEMIISRHGWGHFREIEKRLVEEISSGDNLIIATGGGVVMDKENVKNLKENSFVVWLKAESEVLKARMDKEQRSGKIRPSLTGAAPLEEVKQVMEARAPLYEQAANLVVDTTTLSLMEVASSIIKAIPKGLQG